MVRSISDRSVVSRRKIGALDCPEKKSASVIGSIDICLGGELDVCVQRHCAIYITLKKYEQLDDERGLIREERSVIYFRIEFFSFINCGS